MQKLAFTIQETVKITGISRTKIYELIKNGSLLRRKVGKRSLIMASDLQNFLSNLPTEDISDA